MLFRSAGAGAHEAPIVAAARTALITNSRRMPPPCGLGGFSRKIRPAMASTIVPENEIRSVERRCRLGNFTAAAMRQTSHLIPAPDYIVFANEISHHSVSSANGKVPHETHPFSAAIGRTRILIPTSTDELFGE